MFSKLVLVALVAVVTAAPEGGHSSSHEEYGRYHHSGEFIPILKDERSGPDAYGNYHFEFETGNDIRRHEEGAPHGDEGAVAMQGAWYFTFPDGTPAHLSFVADENGFRPQSDLLPVGPPLPQHAIDQIRFALEQDSYGSHSHEHSHERYD